MKQIQKWYKKSNPDYTFAINGLLPYYDMKLVEVATDTEGQLVVTCPIFVQNFNKMPLTLYKIDTVKVPIEDQNCQVDSYSKVKITKPYIAINRLLYSAMNTRIKNVQTN